ncbi:Transposase domain [Psychrobacillus sp. OK032]|nr:Transposase domain [Psychrobacillus sp. OK032]
MFKYLLLKSIHDLSVVDLVERSKYDMSFKYFLDMAPEDKVIDPSLLTKFRKLRLQGVSLLDMLIGKMVEIALEKGNIKIKTIIVELHIQRHVIIRNPRKIIYKRNQKVFEKQSIKSMNR